MSTALTQLDFGSRPSTGVSQVDRACKAILRTIWINGLRSGDRLPNHSDLREAIGVSNNSLSPAMKRLVAAGVIERKPRVGTVVLDPYALKEIGRAHV